jgi:hypothetical protein
MRQKLSPTELVYQINTHLLYEIEWMLFAATEFKRCDESGYNPHRLALIDSSLVHARNLFEFIKMDKIGSFTLAELGGVSCDKDKWRHFLNNRITHMYDREHDKASWPDGLDNVRNDRFIVMSNTILELLESQGSSIDIADIRKAFDILLETAKTYLSDPSDKSFRKLESLYDASRDGSVY